MSSKTVIKKIVTKVLKLNIIQNAIHIKQISKSTLRRRAKKIIRQTYKNYHVPFMDYITVLEQQNINSPFYYGQFHAKHLFSLLIGEKKTCGFHVDPLKNHTEIISHENFLLRGRVKQILNKKENKEISETEITAYLKDVFENSHTLPVLSSHRLHDMFQPVVKNYLEDKEESWEEHLTPQSMYFKSLLDNYEHMLGNANSRWENLSSPYMSERFSKDEDSDWKAHLKITNTLQLLIKTATVNQYIQALVKSKKINTIVSLSPEKADLFYHSCLRMNQLYGDLGSNDSIPKSRKIFKEILSAVQYLEKEYAQYTIPMMKEYCSKRKGFVSKVTSSHFYPADPITYSRFFDSSNHFASLPKKRKNIRQGFISTYIAACSVDLK